MVWTFTGSIVDRCLQTFIWVELQFGHLGSGLHTAISAMPISTGVVTGTQTLPPRFSANTPRFSVTGPCLVAFETSWAVWLSAAALFTVTSPGFVWQLPLVHLVIPFMGSPSRLESIYCVPCVVEHLWVLQVDRGISKFVQRLCSMLTLHLFPTRYQSETPENCNFTTLDHRSLGRSPVQYSVLLNSFFQSWTTTTAMVSLQPSMQFTSNNFTSKWSFNAAAQVQYYTSLHSLRQNR